MEEIRVTFNTLTPVWTGDAWGENRDIRPSSLIGSLRFWFEMFYKAKGFSIGRLNDKGIPSDSLEDYVKKYNEKNKAKETFDSLLKSELKKSSYKTAIEEVFKKINFPTPLKVFGCTGWRSQISIINIEYSKYRLKQSEVDFSAMYDKLPNSRIRNSKFWAEKLLFTDTREVFLFENIDTYLKISNLVFEEFKEFLKFYEDKVILCGGKKSFGFGFCKIETDESLENISLDCRKITSLYNFKIIDLSLDEDMRKKIILGFNFKHYQRLKEKKMYREKNFGKQEHASNFFFSTKLKDKNKIYLVAFNNFQNNELFNNLIKKYSNFEGLNSGG